jgi:hypothetical protein
MAPIKKHINHKTIHTTIQNRTKKLRKNKNQTNMKEFLKFRGSIVKKLLNDFRENRRQWNLE